MKRISLFCILLLAISLQATASLTTNFTSGFANNGILPDGDLNGWADTRNLSVTEYAGLTVADVQVTLNISGGWNGDLYGYLVHGSGFVVLLDRVGSGNVGAAGYGDSGMSVILGSTGANGSIQTYGGNSIFSSSPSGNYSTITPSAWNSFDGTDVNGNWTLFLADMSSGDISQVTGWALTIEAVPEPATWAMIIFGAAFGCWQLARWRTKHC